MSAVYHKLLDGNLSQDWSTSSLLNQYNNWGNIPSIQGFSTIRWRPWVEDTDPRTADRQQRDQDIDANVLCFTIAGSM